MPNTMSLPLKISPCTARHREFYGHHIWYASIKMPDNRGLTSVFVVKILSSSIVEPATSVLHSYFDSTHVGIEFLELNTSV